MPSPLAADPTQASPLAAQNGPIAPMPRNPARAPPTVEQFAVDAVKGMTIDPVMDAVKALRGQMTPDEAKSFALTSAIGLATPGARGVKPVAKGYARIRGVEYEGPQAHIDQMSAASKAGATKEQIQSMVDGFKVASSNELMTRIEHVSARVQKSHGAVHIADVQSQLPDVPLKDIHAALVQMQREGKISLMQLDNRQAVTPGDHAAAMMVGNDPRHIFMPIGPSQQLRDLRGK